MASMPTPHTLQCSSTSPLLYRTLPHIINYSPGSVYDASGSDEVPTADDTSVKSTEKCCEYEPDAGDEEDNGDNPLSSELLADKDDDLNAVGDESDAAEYGAMDWGDKTEKDALEAEEADGDDCTDTYESLEEDECKATEEEVTAEVLFAEHFLNSFGGEDQVLAGNLKNDVLRSMSAVRGDEVEEPNTYEYLMTPYEPVVNTSSYPGLRQGYSGPTPDALRNADSPPLPVFIF